MLNQRTARVLLDLLSGDVGREVVASNKKYVTCLWIVSSPLSKLYSRVPKEESRLSGCVYPVSSMISRRAASSTDSPASICPLGSS